MAAQKSGQEGAPKRTSSHRGAGQAAEAGKQSADAPKATPSRRGASRPSTPRKEQATAADRAKPAAAVVAKSEAKLNGGTVLSPRSTLASPAPDDVYCD